MEDAEADDTGGLFDIDVDISSATAEPDKPPRDFQSEESFQAVRKTWEPKLETGEVLFLIETSRFHMITC